MFNYYSHVWLHGILLEDNDFWFYFNTAQIKCKHFRDNREEKEGERKGKETNFDQLRVVVFYLLNVISSYTKMNGILHEKRQKDTHTHKIKNDTRGMSTVHNFELFRMKHMKK